MTDLVAWVSLISTISLIIFGVVKIVPELRNSDAGAAKAYMEAAQQAASELRDSQKEAKAELKSVREELAEYKQRVIIAEEELVIVKGRVAMLEIDKSRLEIENSVQLQRIAALEEENRKKDELIMKMQARITILESILIENNIPFPTNGNTG
jgi:outer membrane protein TolC